jgi:hypothetical protein
MSPAVIAALTAMVVGATPEADGEAEWLALEMDHSIAASPERYRQVHADLERIRAAFPRLKSFERRLQPIRLFIVPSAQLEERLRVGGLPAAPEPWRQVATTTARRGASRACGRRSWRLRRR